MDKKKTLTIIMTLILIFALAGCSDSKDKESSSSPSQKDQEMSNIRVNVKFEKLCTDTAKEFKDNKNYPGIVDAYFSVNQEKMEITMNAIVDKGYPAEKTMDLADVLIRRFSANASSQYHELSQPTKSSYGSIFDYYKINVAVAPIGTEKNPKEWYVYKIIPAGRHLPEGTSTVSKITLQDKYKK